MTRVPVILDERLGNWIRQLRPRLHDRPVRWFETRSAKELETLLTGLAFPLVLINLGRSGMDRLNDISLVSSRVPEARILVLDPEAQSGASTVARELGATQVFSGFVPPPIVAELLSRWIEFAQRGIERSGWSRSQFPETQTDPWNWLSDYLGEPVAQRETSLLALAAMKPTSTRRAECFPGRSRVNHDPIQLDPGAFPMKDSD